MNGRKYVHMKYYYEMVSKDSQSVSRKPYTYILGGVYMAKLDGFMALLTGSFNNREQYDALQKEGKEFPYAEHMNTVCNDKISNLPPEFQGKFMVEESIYEVNGKRHCSSHLFLFTEEPEGILLTSYEIPDGNEKTTFSYKNMKTADFQCLKISEKFRPALFQEKAGVWEGGSTSMFTPVMRFQLFERFSKECLEVSETMEVNGKRTFGYDEPICYKQVSD